MLYCSQAYPQSMILLQDNLSSDESNVSMIVTTMCNSTELDVTLDNGTMEMIVTAYLECSLEYGQVYSSEILLTSLAGVSDAGEITTSELIV